ncbi:hypothetical protein [Fowlpox virus]|uniref:Uncharacterized protein n=1 Tax=Fowlpox virus TaxID=10261 RepID=A0A891LWJ2_FOWPV|nr:hypothetical protein [Fowlpox virus]UNS14439.1 ALPV-275 [Albatrosspox virus]UQT20507.1 hypothetical protein [Fowlpox virus]UQT20754.1 hypothetical protein [Fowlpox virus]
MIVCTQEFRAIVISQRLIFFNTLLVNCYVLTEPNSIDDKGSCLEIICVSVSS